MAGRYGGDAGATTYYEYDALNRRTRTVDPLDQTTYFRYDAFVITDEPSFFPRDGRLRQR